MKYRTHQVIRFVNGESKAIYNITGTRGGGGFTHLSIQDGRSYLIRDKHVNWIEIVPDELAEDVWGSEFNVLHTNNRKNTAQSPTPPLSTPLRRHKKGQTPPVGEGRGV